MHAAPSAEGAKNKSNRSITHEKKLLALVCALALVVSLAGCGISTPDTVGSIGDFEISSGLYLLAQYGAYQQAAELASTDQDATDVKAFLKETITTDCRQRRDRRGQRLCGPRKRWRTWRPRRHRCPLCRAGRRADRRTDATADSYAQQLMDQYGDTYTANGIGLETLKAFERIQVKHTALLTLVYGPDGETPVDDAS